MRKIYLLLLATLLHGLIYSQTVSIGAGTNTNGVSPWNPYFGYSYTQTIYLQSEIAASGPITSVSYYYAGTSLTNSDEITLYMGHTTKSSFSGANAWVPLSGMTEVYSGTLTNYSIPGWITIDLATPFNYNDTDNLVIAVDENKANYDGSTTFNATEFAGSNRVLNYSNDNSNPNPASPPAGNRGDLVGNIQIFGLTAQGCQQVTGVNISAVTTNSAVAGWMAPPGGSAVGSYNYELRTSGAAGSGSAGLTASGNSDSTNVSLTTLTGGTTYFLYVRSDCGSTFGLWSPPVTFTTVCTTITTFPWVQNFDFVSTPDLPACMTEINNNQDADMWRTYDSYGTGGSNAAGLNTDFNSGDNDDYLILPQLTLTGHQRMRFSVRNRSNSEPNDFHVVLSTTTADSAAFTTELLPLTTPGSTTQTPIDWIDLSAYTGDVYIAIHVPEGGLDGYYLYVDDIRVEDIPTCDIPVDVTASNFTTTTAQVDWSPPLITAPTSYDVYYSSSDTLPTASTVPSITGVATTTANLTGLMANTTYYVFVRSNCGSGNVGFWTAATTFATLCDATNVPYSEDFESATPPAIPACTSKENAGSGNDWEVDNSPGSDFSDNTLRYSYDLSNAADAWFYTQGLNLTAGTSYRLTFKYGNNSSASYTENLEVKYGNAASSASMSDLIVDYPGIQLGGSAMSSTDFTPATSGVYYIGFHAYSIANQDALYVDDIKVTVTPACDVPAAITISNLTTTSAQVDWTPPSVSAPASYDVYYSTSDSLPAESTVPSITGVTTATANLSGLAVNTTYYIAIRSNCGNGSFSVWASLSSFRTLCNATNVPYTEDFESVTTPEIPNCTSKENAGTGNDWVTDNSPGSGFNSKTLEYVYNSNNADAWFYTQGLNLTAGTSYRLVFKYGNNSTFSSESLEVKFGTSPSYSAMNDLIVDYPDIKIDGSAISTTDFVPSVSGVYYIGFHAYSQPDQFYLFVDDISVKVTPTCDIPTDVIVSNVSTTTAQADWTPPAVGTPASYEVYYNTTGVAPTDTTMPVVTGITATSVQLDSLKASTGYSIWVRSNCGGGDISEWSQKSTFATECDVIIPPTSPEQFDSIPPCWSEGQGILEDPTTFTSTTTSFWTGDNFANRTDTTNTSAKLNIYGISRKDWLITPSYDLGSAGNLQLEFDIALTHYNDTTTTVLGPDDKFVVLISTDNGATWGAANTLRSWDESTPISSTGEHIVIDLSSYTGVVMFAFYGESTASNEDNDLFVDNFAVTVNTSLPVTLSAFTGERQGARNLLLWTTKTEQNNKGFELQRSADGINFSTLAFIESKAVSGTGTSTINYQFADLKPFAAGSYYRLKQVDKDGRFTLSSIVLIKGTRSNSLVLSNVFPNPAKSGLSVVLAAPASDKVNIVISDAAGKVVIQQPAQLVAGDNKVPVNVSKLLAGTYIIRVLCANGCETAVSKFVKQ